MLSEKTDENSKSKNRERTKKKMKKHGQEGAAASKLDDVKTEESAGKR